MGCMCLDCRPLVLRKQYIISLSFGILRPGGIASVASIDLCFRRGSLLGLSPTVTSFGRQRGRTRFLPYEAILDSRESYRWASLNNDFQISLYTDNDVLCNANPG